MNTKAVPMVTPRRLTTTAFLFRAFAAAMYPSGGKLLGVTEDVEFPEVVELVGLVELPDDVLFPDEVTVGDAAATVNTVVCKTVVTTRPEPRPTEAITDVESWTFGEFEDCGLSDLSLAEQPEVQVAKQHCDTSSLLHVSGTFCFPNSLAIYLTFPNFHWLVFDRWCKQYGSDIISLNVLGIRLVLLNTRDVASDTFEKCSRIWSDRPEFPMIKYLLLTVIDRCVEHFHPSLPDRERSVKGFLASAFLGESGGANMVNLYATIACGIISSTFFLLPMLKEFYGATLHDEATYPDPWIFRPERFLKDGEFNSSTQDPIASFGYGRRICPGRFMAYSSVWIGVTGIRTTFDITKAVDENGKMSQSMDTLLDWSASNLAQTMLLA
ncbi:hypothetical protein SERLA73DRAFT_158005 [Serpula lacrymans var. lacrymans S7.3]|uniref:Cytochrome P450 n=1 Tax=Serpula lacrymans var. lacrymans (strain S7.3) TaxID=936435 RepID=F8PK09_SERL3|nr:hypothetical protein SERLA73DRAFT_158005 [Serpula lacrymans var. lacrymans S7.3]